MTLRHDILSIGSNLLGAFARGDDLISLTSAWRHVADRVETAHQTGTLSHLDAQIATTVASKVELLTASLIRIQAGTEDAVEELSTQLRGVLLVEDTTPEPTPKPPLRTSKRSCRPSTRRPALSRSPSPPPPQTHGSTTHDPRSLPLRHWFLSHLSFPYPSPAEKIAIASDCGITRAKVDSDMTNWRRRSGWTDMMVRFSGGDRDVMKRMIDTLLAGRGEKVRGVGEAVEGVRRYLMGEGPKVEVGWIEALPVVGRKPSTTASAPNPRKRRSTTPPEEDLSSDSEIYHSLPTHSRSRPARQMPHIPSISSLSTTSTLINPSNGNGQGRTVSGSSRYSYATDSTYADVDAEELVPKAEMSTAHNSPEAAFSFTPLYASQYGLAPSTTSTQIGRKRPAEPLDAQIGRNVRRLDAEFYHPSYAGEASGSGAATGMSYISSRALSPASSHASGSSEGGGTSVGSPGSVSDVEAYVGYPSFGASGNILQSQGSAGGSGVGMGLGSGEGLAGMSRGSGGMGVGAGEIGQMGLASWSAVPRAPREWASGETFRLPREYEFAPRLEGWVG